MTALPATLDWQDFETLPVITLQVLFTGFGADGNGFGILDWLHRHGITAVRDKDTDEILLHTREREDARMRVGDWLVRGTRNEVYPIRPEVHDDKYRRAES